jgi:hypothetical protein
MHYEFNVSLNGQHLFGTHERSAQSMIQADALAKVLQTKFPKSEGYEVTCTYWAAVGRPVDLEGLHANRDQRAKGRTA